MASWINVTPVVPGQLIGASTIDQVLDDITVLSTHSHTGCPGDGAAQLSQAAKSTTTNTTGMYTSESGLQSATFGGFNAKGVAMGYFKPASNSGWSSVNIDLSSGSNSNTDQVYLTTDSVSASGACTAFLYPIGGSKASESILWTLLMKEGPDAGCISACILESSASLVQLFSGGGGAACNSSTYASASTYHLYDSTWSVPPGLYTFVLKVYGKSTCSSGYGASIAAMGMQNS